MINTSTNTRYEGGNEAWMFLDAFKKTKAAFLT
jgi:hypothetical protein